MESKQLVVAVAAFVLSTLLWVGCYDSRGGGETLQLSVANADRPHVGDTFWVDVQLDRPSSDMTRLASVNFTLHYTNNHMRVVQHERGALAAKESGSYQAMNYPSNAEIEFGITIDSTQHAAAAKTLARVKLRADDVSTDEMPAYLSFSNITAYDTEGRRLALEGTPARMEIRSAAGGEGPAPELRLFTQHAVKNRLTAKRVMLDTPGWIVVRTAAEDASASSVVGTAWVEAGASENVPIELDEALGLADQRIARLEAVLHRDTGTPKQFEYGGEGTPDQPVMRGGRAVTTSFFAQYTDSEPESSITVQNQTLEARTLVVEEVVASEPANLVIHRGRKDRPFIPGIIGKTRVGRGVNRNVQVALFDGATVTCGEVLWPMLHVRTESDDQPYEIDHPIVTKPMTILCE